jgi:hypothetical protein
LINIAILPQGIGDHGNGSTWLVDIQTGKNACAVGLIGFPIKGGVDRQC